MAEQVGEDIYEAGFEAIRRHLQLGGVRTIAHAGRRQEPSRPWARRPPRSRGRSGRTFPRRRHAGDARRQRGRRVDRDRSCAPPTAPSARSAPAGARIVLGAGVTMAQILASRELAFLHPAARAVGGPAVRSAATVGGNLFAPAPYGDFAAALLALDAAVSASGRLRRGGTCRWRSSWPAATGRRRVLVASVAVNRPAEPRRVPLPQGLARQAEGHLGPVDRRPPAALRRARRGRARRLRRDGADADPRQGGRAGARRADPRRGRASRPALAAAAEGTRPRDRRHRQRLVPARGAARAPAAPAPGASPS